MCALRFMRRWWKGTCVKYSATGPFRGHAIAEEIHSPEIADALKI